MMNFLELTKSRYSCRNYSDKSVEDEKVNYILECARMAPSACNKQPWTLVVVRSADLLAKLHQSYNRDWIKNAPLIFVVVVDRELAWHRPSDNKNHSDVDASIISEHIVLAAAEQGLGSCWVCNFDSDMCSKILNLDSKSEPVAIIPIGYPVEDVVLNAKVRKSLDEIVLFK